MIDFNWWVPLCASYTNFSLEFCLFILTLKWLRYFPPVGGGGGVIWTQPQKTTFPVELSDKNCNIGRVRQIMIIRKKLETSIPFSNGGHFTDLPSAWLCNTTKIEKHFPEGEFQRNLAQSSRSSIETDIWHKILKCYSWQILQAK